MTIRDSKAEAVWALVKAHQDAGSKSSSKVSCLGALDILATVESPQLHSLFVSALTEVSSYYNDLAIDCYQILSMPAGTPFIHYVPDSGCGSHIIMLQPIETYPAGPYDTVPYLFGTADRDKLCRDKLNSARYFHENERWTVRYYDGTGWRFVSTLAAVAIVREYCSRIQDKWRTEEQAARRRELGIAV